MAITTTERTNLIKLVVGMFNAAPGSVYLNDVVSLFEATGHNYQVVATTLANTAAYKQLNPSFQTAQEFAAAFLTPLGLQANTTAVDYVVGQFNAGVSKGQIVFNALVALEGTTSAEFANAKAILANKAAVAEYFSVTKNVAETDLADLQLVINAVTADAASVTAAKAAIDAGGVIGGGATLNLTVANETINGTANADVINAFASGVAANGANGTTLNPLDVIDGGSGKDTLNIEVLDTGAGADYNDVIQGTIKNVEVVNIINTGALSAAPVDASKLGTAATEVWQIGKAAAVTKLAATTTAGFKTIGAASALTVAAADAAATAAVALDGVDETATLAVSGAALTGVTISGTVLDGVDLNTTVDKLAVTVTLAKDAQAATLNTAVGTTLTLGNAVGSTKAVTSLDASASTGGIAFVGAAAVASIKTGAGADTLTLATATLKDDPATTAVDETVSAVVESGAGKDTITVSTTGTGTTTVTAGDGDDKVDLTSDGTGKLTVNLGAGNDTFTVTGGSVAGTDVIDGGEGTDNLLLNIIGAANIGAFQNFETFDAKGLAKTLDVEILAAKNTVTEITASGDVGAAAILTNLGAGVGYRVTGDTAFANALTLTQKTAGAMTVTLDIDETSTVALNTVATATDAAAIATNATSLKAVFDSSFTGAAQAATDNIAYLGLTGNKAASLEVVSGGANASNTLVYQYGNAAPLTAAADGLLTTVTITGDRALDVSFSDTAASDLESAIATVDASALTGKLTFNLVDLKAETAVNTFNGGTLKLGTADDVVTLSTGKNLSGLGKGTVEDAVAQQGFDVVKTGAAVQQAADVAATATLTIKDGLFTFNGTGPATLAAAIATVDAQLVTAGDAVVFEYVGNSYLFVDGGPVVKLVGVTGLKGLDEVGTTDTLYVF